MSILSFYSVIEKYRDFDFESYFNSVTDDDIRRSIHERNLTHEDLLNLLSPKAANHLEEMAEKAVQLSLQYFGRTVLLYTPMYISNYCVNKCKYCGYNLENTINRRKLNQEEIKAEAQAIAQEGCRHLILLTGESQEHSPLEYIVESINTIKEYFPSITMEVWPMTVNQYKEVVKAGAEGLTIYQETYDEKVYDKMHLAGPKKNYKFRLDGPERGAMAGMKSISIGALLGLADFRKDAFFTVLHGDYIRRKYPGCDVTYSPPRIRPCKGGLKEVIGVNDKQMVQILLAYRLFAPQCGMNISTRENEEMRRHIIPFGVTKMSAGVSTAVGGHTLKNAGTAQFDINDESSVEEIINMIKSVGYQPILKDWERI